MTDITTPDPANEAKERIKSALIYLQYAVEEARKHGFAKLAIVAEMPDNTGKMLASFQCDDFMNDIALVVGAGPLNDKDRATARAAAFVQRLGIQTKP